MTKGNTRTALTALGLLLLGSNVLAQQSVIEQCKETASDAARIACLESALLAKDGDAPVGIGADQLVARTQTHEEMLEKLEKEEGLVVASYDTVPYEKLLVTLENGQVWRQINGDTQIIRISLKRNQTVNIEESSISGYKMHLNEMQRTVRVERVK